MSNRIMTLLKGFFSLFVSGIERQHPEAILEAEKENLRTQIAKYNQGLASHAALCENLMGQIRRGQTEEQELRAKTTMHLRAGNKDMAAQLALRLQSVTRDLQDNNKQLEQAETTYKELVKARDVTVKAARDKIDSLKRSIDDMKIKRAQAELTEMASGMISTLGGGGDTLNRLQDMVEEERNKAAGRARVAKDSLDMTDINMKETEQKALADQALADFAAHEGIVLEPSESNAAPTATNKTMGPVTETSQGA